MTAFGKEFQTTYHELHNVRGHTFNRIAVIVEIVGEFEQSHDWIFFKGSNVLGYLLFIRRRIKNRHISVGQEHGFVAKARANVL